MYLGGDASGNALVWGGRGEEGRYTFPVEPKGCAATAKSRPDSLTD